MEKNWWERLPKKGYFTACGGQIKDPERYPSAEYKGRTFYFCNRGCLNAFFKDPDRFMAGEIPHPTGTGQLEPFEKKN